MSDPTIPQKPPFKETDEFKRLRAQYEHDLADHLLGSQIWQRRRLEQFNRDAGNLRKVIGDNTNRVTTDA